MDIARIKSLRLNLSAHFVIIAWLTAMLVATGSGTVFLPLFIFIVSIIAFVFVDCLEVFELKSVASAIGMILATAVAIVTYVYSAMNNSESGQLLAVAGLLVYPEAVLFLQRKNLRVFEQLAVFLLLEMIVAALVNDNILFGLLLAPTMLIWVSSLFLFSRYATLVKIDGSIEKQNPKLAEMLFRRFMRTVMGSSRKSPLATAKFVPSVEVQSSRTFRRAVLSFPIGVGALVFAGLFFYLVPRTSTGSFGSGVRSTTTIGLPDRLTFGNVGRALQDPAPVMRVTLRDPDTDVPFRPESPPYLRARLFSQYGPIPGQDRRRNGEWQFLESLSPRRLGARSYAQPGETIVSEPEEIRRLQDAGRQIVNVHFELRPESKGDMFVIPPVYSSGRKQDVMLSYDEIRMLMQPRDNTGLALKTSSQYDILSSGFLNGRQASVTPARLTRVDSYKDRTYSELQFRLTRGFNVIPGNIRFDRANQYRLDILRRSGVDESNKIAAALAFDQHLAFSGDFSYTLDLRPPTDASIDPIEDFLINQRAGHCQYFATALVCLLRQTDIPSRLVIGYRPTEYNSIGDYFLVRQKDAHAWVEALFTREQLEGSVLERQLTGDDFYWVRFDPTPPPDGVLEVRDQQGQAMDYAEKLWKEYVVEGQKLRSENSIYAPVAESKEAYAGLFAQFQNAFKQLQAGEGIGALGFAWPVAILVTVLGLMVLLGWQAIVWLPRIAPQLALRLGVVKSEIELRHPFYARCLKLVGRLGLYRDRGDTPQEYVTQAQRILARRGQDAQPSLAFLTNLYYRMRFGKDAHLTREEKQAAERELTKLQQAIAAAQEPGKSSSGG